MQGSKLVVRGKNSRSIEEILAQMKDVHKAAREGDMALMQAIVKHAPDRIKEIDEVLCGAGPAG